MMAEIYCGGFHSQIDTFQRIHQHGAPGGESRLKVMEGITTDSGGSEVSL
nr:hypothetical protein [Neobacillus sp. Marseille-Q6967]